MAEETKLVRVYRGQQLKIDGELTLIPAGVCELPADIADALCATPDAAIISDEPETEKPEKAPSKSTKAKSSK